MRSDPVAWLIRAAGAATLVGAIVFNDDHTISKGTMWTIVIATVVAVMLALRTGVGSPKKPG